MNINSENNGENRDNNTKKEENDNDNEIDLDNVDYYSKISIKKIETKVINERKIQINIIADVMISFYIKNEIEFVKEIANEESKILKLEKNIKLDNLIESSSTKVGIKEDVKITDVEKVVNIVKVDYSIDNIESKVSYNKVLVKGDCKIDFLYRTEENKLSKMTCNLPVMGFIDVIGITDKNTCDLKGSILKANINIITENSVNVEMEFNFCCDVYENIEINLIEDLYSLSKNLKSEKRKVLIDNDIIEKISNKNINKKVLIDDVNELYDTAITINILAENIEDNIKKINGNLEINYLYNTFESKNIISKNEIFDFDFEVNKEVENYDVILDNSNFIILPDSSIDNKLEISLVSSSKESRSLNLIENIEEIKDDDKGKSDEEKNYSVVIYFVQKGDSLWKIAKRFKSTVSDIARINDIEDENKIDIGQKLYIPKAV